jgi:hypothetical protein
MKKLVIFACALLLLANTDDANARHYRRYRRYHKKVVKVHKPQEHYSFVEGRYKNSEIIEKMKNEILPDAENAAIKKPAEKKTIEPEAKPTQQPTKNVRQEVRVVHPEPPKDVPKTTTPPYIKETKTILFFKKKNTPKNNKEELSIQPTKVSTKCKKEKTTESPKTAKKLSYLQRFIHTIHLKKTKHPSIHSTSIRLSSANMEIIADALSEFLATDSQNPIFIAPGRGSLILDNSLRQKGMSIVQTPEKADTLVYHIFKVGNGIVTQFELGNHQGNHQGSCYATFGEKHQLQKPIFTTQNTGSIDHVR